MFFYVHLKEIKDRHHCDFYIDKKNFYKFYSVVDHVLPEIFFSLYCSYHLETTFLLIKNNQNNTKSKKIGKSRIEISKTFFNYIEDMQIYR